MQVNIRGGTHYESSLIPGNTTVVLGTGTRRGQDLATFYTLAWLDKYVKGDASADSRLLTDRWCDDDLSREVDLNGDGNMYSFYFRSRRDITLSGGAASTSEDLRSDCPADATDPPFDMVAAANTPDTAAVAAGPGPGTAGSGKRNCAKLRQKLKRAKPGAQRKKAKRKLRRCRAR
jgi:hypothetical protein